MGRESFFGGNLVGQENWARRGENESRIATLETNAAAVNPSTITMGVWALYGPALTNITLGNGTLVGRWARIGRTVVMTVTLDLGTTSTVTGNATISAPVAAANLGAQYVGVLHLLDNGVRIYDGNCVLPANSSTIGLYHDQAGNAGIVNGTNPFTFGNTDRMILGLTYEAAT